MTPLRKILSAVRVFRDKGAGDLMALARVRATEVLHAKRPLPLAPEHRARLIATALNRWGGLSPVPVVAADLTGIRDALILPYLRHRHADAAAAVASLSPPLSQLEAAIAADSLLAVWDFPGIAAASPSWKIAAAGTPFLVRVEQVAVRAALRLGRLAEAARGIEGADHDRGALTLRGDVCDALGRMDEARDAYEAAIRRDGADPYAREAYGFHLMKRGALRDGLASWMAADTLAKNYPLRRGRPRWTGEALGARSLMIVFEHGLGDMVQMARFLPRLLAREPEATVLACVPTPLIGLLSRQFPRVAFSSVDGREPDYDLFVPSMHLPAVLDAADVEPRSHYLALGAPARRGSPRPRVGVCWRGHPRQYEFTRSIPLDAFAALFAATDVDFVVLLNRLTPAEAAAVARVPNVAVPVIKDFVDLGALLASCDLVVSVDTAVVHLAGAGGLPTLLLSRPDGCWRWGTEGVSGPWYSSVEVLRHGGDLDWSRLLAIADGRIRALDRAAAA